MGTRTRYRAALLAACIASLSIVGNEAAGQSRYRAQRTGDVVRLEDAETGTRLSIVPSIGNIAFELSVRGENVLRWPFPSLEAFRAKPGFSGIPFMGPWANRLDEQAFYANGRKYNFDMELGNVRGTTPIHGFLTTTDQWTLEEARADGSGAWSASVLEFFRYPMWMKQFPFAHAIRMTYRLENGVVEVRTRIENMGREPMPVSIGFHPYFQLTDSPREDWTLSVGAATQWLLAPNKIPTGETQPISQFFPDPGRVALKDFDLDHVFGDLVRDGTGRAVVRVHGRTQQIEVSLGPKYRAVVLYSPSPAAGRGGAAGDRGFICIEPMAGITNAMNLAHKGLYNELQSIPPGEAWEESFWVKTTGF
jgi:aldose 1-epimerase